MGKTPGRAARVSCRAVAGGGLWAGPNSPDVLLQLDEGPMGEPEGTFVDYQTTMVKTAKAIAVTVQEMVGAEAAVLQPHPAGQLPSLLPCPTAEPV